MRVCLGQSERGRYTRVAVNSMDACLIAGEGRSIDAYTHYSRQNTSHHLRGRAAGGSSDRRRRLSAPGGDGGGGQQPYSGTTVAQSGFADAHLAAVDRLASTGLDGAGAGFAAADDHYSVYPLSRLGSA